MEPKISTPKRRSSMARHLTTSKKANASVLSPIMPREDQMEQLSPADQLNLCYKSDKALGRGSFGTVFKARCLRTDKEVAIKKIELDNEDSFNSYKKIVSEIQILKHLSRVEPGCEPLVTNLLDVIVPQNTSCLRKFEYYLVMDCVPLDLRTLLIRAEKNQFAMDESTVVRILYDMLCAMNFFHSAGLVHRDVKPSNFLVRSDRSVILCDFGNSRTARPESLMELRKARLNIKPVKTQLGGVMKDLKSGNKFGGSPLYTEEV